MTRLVATAPLRRPPYRLRRVVCLWLFVIATTTGCSLKSYAINMVGDALSEGNSVYETDEDLILVGEALLFGLKLTESLLEQSPNHHGLLLTASRGFVLYAYGYVHYQAERAVDEDLDRARLLRMRARKLYLRAVRYGMRALEHEYRGFEQQLTTDPTAAVTRVAADRAGRDVPLLYWTATALGLAISVSTDDAAMLARLPEVEAMVDRALQIDESWDEGALHEFKVTLAGAQPGARDFDVIKRHYDRALELSGGRHAGLHLAYAEAVSVPTQNTEEFRSLVAVALAVNPDAAPESRLVNLLAHRRAHWLGDRVDELIIDDPIIQSSQGDPE